MREDTDSSMVQEKMKTAEYAEEFRKASLRLLPYWFSFFFVFSYIYNWFIAKVRIFIHYV